MRSVIWITAMAVVVVMIPECLSKRRYIEMTHEIHDQIVTYPGLPKYNFTILEKGDKRGFWLEYNKFQLSEHAGTHIDAPVHFNRHGQYLHEVPLDNLVGPGVIIDISHRAQRDRSAEVEIADIDKWESEHGEIPRGAFVIMKSGWFKKYPNTTQIFGVDVNTRPSTEFRFPGISPAAAKWLIDYRDINGVGGDTPSPDVGGGTEFRTHRTILGANKVILENVANLDQVPSYGAMIYAIPVNLRRGSGGPLRIFATVNDRQTYDYSGVARHLPALELIISCFLMLLWRCS